jgi:hypothetical protein
MLNRRFLKPYSAAQESYTVTYLVIAGGGAGGSRISTEDYYLGSGGGGGYVTGSFTAVIGTTYTIDIGAGGARNTNMSSSYTKGDNGDNSTISGGTLTTITATGGGAGGVLDHPVNNPLHNNDINAGASGGSGGGGVGWGNDTDGYGGSTVAATGTGITTTVQGFAGGYGTPAADSAGAGGGGAGGAGQSPTGVYSENGGTGGAGKTSSITGVSRYYAAGAGGGKGYGTSAGATGSNGSGYQGIDNTGDGGNAGVQSDSAVNGNSGVIILQFDDTITGYSTVGSPTENPEGASTPSGKKILRYTGDGSFIA